jgi:EAL domain-containing protein (putative c-di-GMP-specific phosphodiesterase class I)
MFLRRILFRLPKKPDSLWRSGNGYSPKRSRRRRAGRPKGIDLVVAINVSALQFQSATFIDSVAAALSQAGLEPYRLELELTESILIHDINETLAKLQALARLGVGLSIDDFGTGYSSLTYLKRFPVQKLKIDRSFVNGLPDDESDLAIASAIVNLGLALHLRVIAEGVETERQKELPARSGLPRVSGLSLCSRRSTVTFWKPGWPNQTPDLQGNLPGQALRTS